VRSLPIVICQARAGWSAPAPAHQGNTYYGGDEGPRTALVAGNFTQQALPSPSSLLLSGRTRTHTLTHSGSGSAAAAVAAGRGTAATADDGAGLAAEEDDEEDVGGSAARLGSPIDPTGGRSLQGLQEEAV
jgi:hypothetical protein